MLEKLKEWRRKRKWNAELQLYYLRLMVMQDARWMAHNPIVSQLTDRYLRMLSDTWESQPQEGVEHFRERIGLDPHKRSNAIGEGPGAALCARSLSTDGLERKR